MPVSWLRSLSLLGRFTRLRSLWCGLLFTAYIRPGPGLRRSFSTLLRGYAGLILLWGYAGLPCAAPGSGLHGRSGRLLGGLLVVSGRDLLLLGGDASVT